jgi:hypothetical protein
MLSERHQGVIGVIKSAVVLLAARKSSFRRSGMIPARKTARIVLEFLFSPLGTG